MSFPCDNSPYHVIKAGEEGNKPTLKIMEKWYKERKVQEETILGVSTRRDTKLYVYQIIL
jgi:hypothetical protein